jgi:hypothetical protein
MKQVLKSYDIFLSNTNFDKTKPFCFFFLKTSKNCRFRSALGVTTEDLTFKSQFGNPLGGTPPRGGSWRFAKIGVLSHGVWRP